MARASLFLVVLGCAGATPVLAAECRLPKNSNEAKLLAFYSAPLSFSPASAPEHALTWTLRLGVEGGPILEPDSAIRQSSLCYVRKTENTQLSPFFARPRLTLTLPGGFALEASYLPPIKIHDAEPNLGSAALSWVKRLKLASTGNSTDIMLRFHGTAGQVKGSITCPSKSLQTTNPAQACYGTKPSLDTFKPTIAGVEAILSTAAWDGRLAFYAGGGKNFLRPRFRVGFTDTEGNVDNTLLVVDLNRIALFGGVTAEVSSTFDLSAQAYGVRNDGVTFRFGGGYRVHR